MKIIILDSAFLFVIILTLLKPNSGHLALDNGLARTPPMGWLSWTRFFCETDCQKFPKGCINHDLYAEMADAMVKGGYLAAGYNYVNIDDCWSEMERSGDTEPKMMPHKKRFPYGIEGLAKYVHDKGLKLGLYSDIGTKTCAGYPGHWKGEGNGDYIDIDAKTFASWEIDSLKVDGCNIEPDERMNSLYYKLSEALNQTGRPIFYYCSAPFFQGRKTPANKIDFKGMREHCNGWRFYEDIADNWQSVTGIIDFYTKNVEVYKNYNGPGGWFDPDMIIVGNKGLNVEQSKAQMSIWSMMAAPLLMSNDLRDIGDEFKEILLNPHVIAVDQNPLGIMGKRVIAKGKTEVWHRQLDKDNEGSHAVVFFNRGNEQVTMKYALMDIFDSFAYAYDIHDLWDDNKKIASLQMLDDLELEVPATAVRMVKLLPVKPPKM